MKLKFCAGIALALLAAPAHAQPIDPHMTISAAQGQFVLHYYGTLDDGTVCPPSPNALRFGFEYAGGLRTVHGVVLDGDADPSLGPMFQTGAYCSIAFEGSVRFQTHHGTMAYMTPTAIASVAGGPPPNPDATRTPDYAGAFTIAYYPIMCLIPPCPPGTYGIFDAAGTSLGWGLDTLAMTAPTGQSETVSGRYLDFDSASGRIWVEGDMARIDIDAILE